MFEHRRRIHGIPTPRSHESSVNLLQPPGDDNESDDSGMSMDDEPPSEASRGDDRSDRFHATTMRRRLDSIVEGPSTDSSTVGAPSPQAQGLSSTLKILQEQQRALEQQKRAYIKEIDGKIDAVAQTIRLLTGEDQTAFKAESDCPEPRSG